MIAAIILLVGAFILLVWAPWQVWLGEHRRLNHFTQIPIVWVELNRLLLPHVGWLIRLEVTSTAPVAHDFCAQIVETEDLTLVEAPWWIPWRHDRTRLTRLYPNVPEMLKIGTVRANGMYCHVLKYEGEAEGNDWGEITEEARLEFRIWDPLTGRVARQGRLLIPGVQHHGPDGPEVVLLVDPPPPWEPEPG